MSASNGAHFVGYVTKEPERRSDKAPWILRIGVDGAGNTFDTAGYFNIACFDNLFGNLMPHIRPGSRVAVDADIQHRTWQGEDGSTNSQVAFRATSIDLIKTGSGEGGSGGSPRKGKAQQSSGGGGSDPSAAKQPAPVSSGGSGVEELFDEF